MKARTVEKSFLVWPEGWHNFPAWRRTFHQLVNTHGFTVANAITLGRHVPTSQDIGRWRALGQP